VGEEIEEVERRGGRGWSERRKESGVRKEGGVRKKVE
jgi:hypothetical protein